MQMREGRGSTKKIRQKAEQQIRERERIGVALVDNVELIYGMPAKNDISAK